MAFACKPTSTQQPEFTMADHTALIIGASRGLGLALAAEYLHRGSHVIATVRGKTPPALRQLESSTGDRLAIAQVDITEREELAALHRQLRGRALDVLFVNAGVASDADKTAAEIPIDSFLGIMRTNVLGAMQTVEMLYDLLAPDGTVAVMSSGLGSISENTTGSWNSYAASKAALNMMMRGFASRHADDGRAMLLIAPGWVRTEMGGQGASLGIEESIPRVVDVVSAQRGKPGLQYLNYQGRTVGW
jgi:NAD(P)-dependent dehydrogenase (short-subunit alcohol dehydrogenase family)